MEQVTRDQEIPQWLMYEQRLLEAYVNISPEICLFHWCTFSLVKAKLPVFGLPSINAGLSEFPNYQTSD
jgi:hypothetical protein